MRGEQKFKNGNILVLYLLTMEPTTSCERARKGFILNNKNHSKRVFHSRKKDIQNRNECLGTRNSYIYLVITIYRHVLGDALNMVILAKNVGPCLWGAYHWDKQMEWYVCVSLQKGGPRRRDSHHTWFCALLDVTLWRNGWFIRSEIRITVWHSKERAVEPVIFRNNFRWYRRDLKCSCIF